MMPMAPPPAQIVAAAPRPAVATMGADTKGRPTIAIVIDGKEPVDAIVDTGAERTILSKETARTFGLTPVGPETRVNGIAGGEAASSYAVASLSSGLFDVTGVDLLALSSIGVTSAKAIVGMDLFQDRKLTFDPQRHQIRAAPSGPAPAGSFTIVGKTRAGGLMFVPLVVNGIPMQALIDSGAEGCIGGPDVREALGWDADDYRLTPYGQISGASDGNLGAQIGRMDRLTIGPVSFRDIPIVFLTKPASRGVDPTKPTMIIGLDVLARLGSYTLDFPRGEFQITLPSGARPAEPVIERRAS